MSCEQDEEQERYVGQNMEYKMNWIISDMLNGKYFTATTNDVSIFNNVQQTGT